MNTGTLNYASAKPELSSRTRGLVLVVTAVNLLFALGPSVALSALGFSMSDFWGSGSYPFHPMPPRAKPWLVPVTITTICEIVFALGSGVFAIVLTVRAFKILPMESKTWFTIAVLFAAALLCGYCSLERGGMLIIL